MKRRKSKRRAAVRSHKKRRRTFERAQAQTKRRGKTRSSVRPLTERRLRSIIRKLKKGESLTASAKGVGLRPDQLRGVLRSAKIIQKRKGRWRLREVPVSMSIYSEGEAKTLIPADRRNRSLVGKYLNAVKAFLRTNKSERLAAFKNRSVRDIFGKRYQFEADENTLYRLASSGSETVDEIYKYIA